MIIIIIVQWSFFGIYVHGMIEEYIISMCFALWWFIQAFNLAVEISHL